MLGLSYVQKLLEHLVIIRRPKPRRRIPLRHRREPLRATVRIRALIDIVEDLRMSIDERIEEPQRPLPICARSSLISVTIAASSGDERDVPAESNDG